MQLNNKVVFITGGSGGIGSACAKAVLEQGAKVVVADINEETATTLIKALEDEFGKDRVVFIRCDVSDARSFKDAFNKALEIFGNVDIVFNNAGIIQEHDWEKTLNVNLKGVIHGTELANAHMRKDKGGKGGVVINMSSLAGYSPHFFIPTYTASKHAVIGYTRSLANVPDLAAQGIRYACILPHGVDTPIANTVVPGCRQEYAHILLEGESTSKKPAQPRLVADGFLSLIEDDSSNDALLEISLEDGLVRKKLVMENV